MENKFKPAKIFFELYEEIKTPFISQHLAYLKAEKIFSNACQKAFGTPYRKFQNFETFLTMYYKYKNQ
jgi:hypothetical protein